MPAEQIGVKHYMKGVYDKTPTRRIDENKANLSLREQTRPEPVERTQIRAAETNDRLMTTGFRSMMKHTLLAIGQRYFPG